MDEHARYGGVIPEIASRAHAELRAMRLQSSGRREHDAVRRRRDRRIRGTGLAGCLAVGVSGAKSLAWAANKPNLRHQHVIGHIA